MLNKLFRLLGKGKEDRLTSADPSFGYSGVAAVATLLANKQYDSIPKVYNGLRADQRMALVEGICMSEAYADQVMEWQKQRPECPTAHLFSGALWTHTAWLARTGQRAKHVSQERAEVFFEHLEHGYEQLSAAIEGNPADAEAYARMIRVLMGLSQPVSLLYEYYHAMDEREPEHLYGNMYLLNALSAKWLGSDAQMMDFTHRAIAGRHEGSLLYTLVPMAHTEIWLNLPNQEAEGYRVSHFRDKEVRGQIHAAYKHSVLSGKLADSVLRPVLFNYFCFAFHRMGARQYTLDTHKAFGDQMTFYPWTYEGVLTPKELKAYLATRN